MKWSVLCLFVLSLACCGPQEQGFLSSFELKETEPSSEPLIYQAQRTGSELFTPSLSSHKLDLVFVLDSQPGMQNLLKKNMFGSDFLKYFEAYDWRLAYTNTGVDFESFEEKKPASSCRPLSGILSFVAGVAIESPFFVVGGGKKLKPCFTSAQKKPKAVNGKFLPFEQEGKEGATFLTKNQDDYQSLFNHTFQKREKPDKRVFDAPQKQGEGSYPSTSFILSLFNNQEGFFRDDSQVVYVVITPEDSKKKLSVEAVRKQFDILYGNGERLHIVSAVIKDEFSPCLAYMETLGLSSARAGKELMKLSEGMQAKTIDLCSKNFERQLAGGIRRYLHPSLDL